MVALVLHLWHIVAPGGKLGVSSSASAWEGIAPAEAEALDPGARRDEVSEAVGDLADLTPTSDFFFVRAS